MPLYVYQKKLPDVIPPPPLAVSGIAPPKKKFVVHPLPIVTSLLGLVLIASVVWPVLSYEITNKDKSSTTTASGLLNPLVEDQPQLSDASPRVVGSSDFTKASNWFPTALATSPVTSTKMGLYYLSVPKLRIENALVQLDSDDLTRGLVHYPGTSLPGDYGSPVIFGHSILPQFYNPKNYMAIFSLLPTLDPGDEIIITADNVTYTYLVSSKYEVYPNDLSPLEQRYDSRQLKLITCVPPGLKTRRLVVVADLQKL